MSSAPSSIAADLRRLQATAQPIWLQVGKVFTGTDAKVITNGHVVFTAQGIRLKSNCPKPKPD